MKQTIVGVKELHVIIVKECDTLRRSVGPRMGSHLTEIESMKMVRPCVISVINTGIWQGHVREEAY